METSESQFIRERCLKLIRESSMNEGTWEMTLLGRCHEAIADSVPLRDDEHPIISFYAGPGDWTLYSTHRLIGERSGLRCGMDTADFGSTDFGDFKEDTDAPRVTDAMVHGRHGMRRSQVFLYESGYASMAPIHDFKFWRLKWPVWRETWRLQQ